jgi:uncharacterized protein (DUF1330 family)
MSMPAYVLVVREGQIRDLSEMEIYQRMARAIPPHPKLTALAAYGAMEALEGEAPDGVVLLQFPTVEDAKDWYNSPAYQAAVPHRQKSANYRAFILQGL